MLGKEKHHLSTKTALSRGVGTPPRVYA